IDLGSKGSHFGSHHHYTSFAMTKNFFLLELRFAGFRVFQQAAVDFETVCGGKDRGEDRWREWPNGETTHAIRGDLHLAPGTNWFDCRRSAGR
ncbi:MAG TPA: hypothetical protein VEL31_26695, partial [Ktedonobacteraceae bacterium]|nr:hypothetical protein [Ktedonobacteraceae bacterium]